MHFNALALFVALIGLGGAQQETPTAEALLSKARDAASALDGVHYRAKYVRSLEVAGSVWRAEGFVWREGRGKDSRLKVEAEARFPRPTPERQVTIARIGERWTYSDHRDSTHCSGATARIGGDAAALALGLDVGTLFDAAPYGTEVGLAVEGEAQIGGVACWVLATRSEDGLVERKRWLAKTDLLPRRIERATTLGRSESMTELITLIDFDPSARPTFPAIEIPDGFEETEPQTAVPLDEDLPPYRERTVPVKELGSLDELSQAFNASAGRRRLIGIFSPT